MALYKCRIIIIIIIIYGFLSVMMMTTMIKYSVEKQ